MQRQLSPTAPDLGVGAPQGRVQTPRHSLQIAQLRAQAAVGALAAFSISWICFSYLPERFLQRPDQRVNRLLAAVEISLGLCLDSLEGAFCEIQECLIVALERLVGESIKSVGKILLGVLKEFFFLLQADAGFA